jgi:hypothetical protein
MCADSSNAYAHTARVLSRILQSHGSRTGTVRFLENESDVHQWVSFDDEVYAPGLVTYPLLSGWWRRYKNGAIALFRNEQIDAILAIWPLTELAFEQVVKGEKNLERRSLSSLPDETLRVCI